LHVPLPPDDIVESNLVLQPHVGTLEVPPFRGCQRAATLNTAGQQRISDNASNRKQ